MAGGLNNPASICCCSLPWTVPMLQFTLRSWGWFIHGRHKEHLWLTCNHFARKQVWWHGFNLPLALLTHAISSSPISSDVLLSNATIVFGIVLDIVLALIINRSNYCGPYPSLWKQYVEQEKTVCVHKHMYSGLQCRMSTGEKLNSLIKCSLYVLQPKCTLPFSDQCAATYTTGSF